jgi:hypothetical protein
MASPSPLVSKLGAPHRQIGLRLLELRIRSQPPDDVFTTAGTPVSRGPLVDWLQMEFVIVVGRSNKGSGVPPRGNNERRR